MAPSLQIVYSTKLILRLGEKVTEILERNKTKQNIEGPHTSPSLKQRTPAYTFQAAVSVFSCGPVFSNLPES
jgi:hypothetical protein